MPAYANFDTRLNNLKGTLPYLIEYMLEKIQGIENQHIDWKYSIIDSFPIMLYSGKKQGKMASEL